MTRQWRVAARMMTGIVTLACLAGCGSDASAGTFTRNTPTAAALRRAATPAPTATPIPSRA